jgi:glycosyltransferase involved in cell wall biosynthesis
MRILVLSWEFPPRIVGGISRHVAELYPEIIKLDHEIHLITLEFGHAPPYELVDEVHIHRVAVEPCDNFLQWIVNLNQSMGSYGGQLIQKNGPFDVIHAHDWLVGDAAIALKETFKIPLVATIHATEYGRNHGLHNDIQRYIASKEGILIYSAWRVIVCSGYMRHELNRVFGTPWDKVDVVYNGIRREKKHRDPFFDYWQFRRQFADDTEKIVYYVGRMTREKGVSVLLNSASQVLRELQGQVKFVIIGGGNTNPLREQAKSLDIWPKCYFTGFMSDEYLDRFQTIADCAVFPSLYEPFGIVALESFAAKVPVVVSDTGGLPEVVRHGQTGIVTHCNDPHSLAWGILEILNNPNYAQWLVENAYDDLERRFDWTKLAQQTEAVFGLVLHERSQGDW